MADLRMKAAVAILRALARGPRTRNELLRRIAPPSGVPESTWYAVLKETLEDFVRCGRLSVREVPGTPVRQYSAPAKASRDKCEAGNSQRR